jgi:hypothetical protein
LTYFYYLKYKLKRLIIKWHKIVKLGLEDLHIQFKDNIFRVTYKRNYHDCFDACFIIFKGYCGHIPHLKAETLFAKPFAKITNECVTTDFEKE